jgi:hypothetical protein
MAVPIRSRMGIPEDGQKLMPRADLQVLLPISVDVVEILLLITKVTILGALEERELQVTGDQSQPAGVITFGTAVMLIGEFVCMAFFRPYGVDAMVC